MSFIQVQARKTFYVILDYKGMCLSSRRAHRLTILLAMLYKKFFLFFRLEPNDIVNILRNTVPDIGIFISSLIFLISFKKLLPAPDCEADSSPVAQKRTPLTTMRRLVGNFFVVFMLAASGIAYPSILSAVYFVLFLMVVTWLSCLRTLGARFAILRCVLLVYCGIHMILLYLYQFKFFQSSLPPQNSVTR